MQSAITSGRTIGTTLVVLAVVATLSALLLPIHFFDGNRTIAIARSGWEDDGKGTWKTEYGPLTALDRDFVQKVRTSAMWEVPAGRSAKERGTRKSVKAVGDELVEDYTDLDKRAIDVGRTLGVSLPAKPAGPQQENLDALRQARGEKFDEVFVNQVRKQAGQDLSLIALVRDQTRNSLMRTLATRANAAVLSHLTSVEETGLVDFESLPQVE